MNNNMNNNNNNLGGEVLGNVGNVNQIPNNNIEPNYNNIANEIETLETLDAVPSNKIDTTLNSVNNNIDTLNMGVNTNPNSYVHEEAKIMPEPAYTNPNTINPMPGFENSGTIGTTPPVSLEPEKKPSNKKKGNKTLFIIIILFLILGIGAGTYYVLKYTDILNKGPQIAISTKDFEINLGESLPTDIKDYAIVTGTDIKNCVLNMLDINNNEEGTYTYKITCGEVMKTGSVVVVDNSELVVNTTKVYKTVLETVEVEEFIDEPSSDITYSFVNATEVENNLKTVGTYKIKIKATKGSKESEVEAELVVLEHKIKGYLTCSSNNQNLSNSSATMKIANKFAIADDETNKFGKVAQEIHTFKFTDETEYTNYVAEFKTNGSVTINNVTGVTEFDDSNLTITITIDKKENELINEYGNTVIENYKSIKTYFEATLKYTCVYK